MNVSQNKLNEYINLYLNDLADYSDEDQSYTLAESVLNPLKQLIMESKQDTSIILKEALIKASPEKRVILEDFMLYIQEA
jgi:hypothetical protein